MASREERLEELRVLAGIRAGLEEQAAAATASLRDAAVSAVRAGASKVDVAREGHLSRVTLDRWLRDSGK
ncbi:hypothetical protein [Actinomyces urogenitalis]|uniref:hypothetical protein n=1 Tax=Actinomyces urogenitalis TaxID=103621 RepID=UPI0028FEDB3E|nr:hypothetical protein [Actinomyces urogenitalis]MDU0865269.1 hypothetical protein [Actinomyces urogenitalis]MDU0875705.1 hypothetical protein [Actinomyces urogenitalis]MDU1565548.1 hypothetical protein [Actinomyces urogenitalis]MDU1640818.1 hypothetical protein [Actinomyces urogenitalis]MDU6778535.1 hypothetical protein [Actinomyces urogenitalis]